MTEESVAMVELAEKHAVDDYLGELRQFTLERLMELVTDDGLWRGTPGRQ